MLRKIVSWSVLAMLLVGISTSTFNIYISSNVMKESFIVRGDFDPLQIEGPMFAEVNDTLSFVVTSGGLPVEGAIVSFASYTARTDARGVAHFQVDFAGSFKVVAEKEGYQSFSTLLWILPKGNEKFPIRGVTAHPNNLGLAFSAYKMAGANFVEIPALYMYDSQGNIYPSIHGAKWVNVTNEVQQQSLAWEISRARDWGFKIYLRYHTSPLWYGLQLPPDPGAVPVGEAKQIYKEQLRKEMLLLAEFAEKYDVDIFDALGRPHAIPAEELIPIYEELLPELRKKFSGELAVSGFEFNTIIGTEETLPEYNYTGFDYVTPIFYIGLTTDSPEEVRNMISACFDFGEYLRAKYGVKILPIWVNAIELYEESSHLYDAFFRVFNNSYEAARTWLFNVIFEEASKRDVEGVGTRGLWFFEQCIGPSGIWEGVRGFAAYESRTPLNVVAKNFHRPWNEKRKMTWKMLLLAELAANSVARSSDTDFVRWTSRRLEEALGAYERSEYELVYLVAQQILRKAWLKVENPLGIIVDGDKSEWQCADPIYFNPSQTFPWFNFLWLNNTEVKKQGNLKCVYAINDPRSLYITLEFYDSAPFPMGEPPGPPYIGIDVSGEWSHKHGEEFYMIINAPLASLWSSDYNGTEWSFAEADYPSSLIGEVQCAVDPGGKVVEIRIPLDLIQNPERINLVVWYPRSAFWGDMEVNMVDWGATKFLELIEPMDGSTVYGIIPIKVAASDNISLARMELYVDESLIDDVPLNSSKTYIYTTSLDTRTLVNDNHSITVKLYNILGNMTITSSLISVQNLLTDLNGDGTVNILDIVIVARAYGAEYNETDGMYWHDPPCKGCPHTKDADLNDDKVINIIDIATVARDYGKTT